MFLKSEKKP